jgi:thymidylate synthase ThyX
MLLESFFTNLDRPVFALRNLPEVVRGAMFSRYSRSPHDLRTLFLREFLRDPESGLSVLEQGVTETDVLVNVQRAENFYKRVLAGYGDDSVAELAGAHLACERVSNLAVKVIEDSRIGISPIEKSTRYVRFDDRVNGQYQYYRPAEIMASPHAERFIQTIDHLFDVYSMLVQEMISYFKAHFPRDPTQESERAYESTIRAKACDTVRGLLPAATLTNIGLYGNGRAFEYLLVKMRASRLTEARELSQVMFGELRQVIPAFITRAYDGYGDELDDYLRRSRDNIEQVATDFWRVDNRYPPSNDPVKLVWWDPEAEDKVVAAILYPARHEEMVEILRYVRTLRREQKRQIIPAYCAHRGNRRHKPGRAFEHVYYLFDLLGNFGIYRDLHRGRMLTQEPQQLTVIHGYDDPAVWIVDAGYADEYKAALDRATETFLALEKDLPVAAQYVVPFAFRRRWYQHINLRELYWQTELRTVPQGHPDYRVICQEMFRQVQAIHPFLVEAMKFVDLNQYDLERREAERRIDERLRHLRT